MRAEQIEASESLTQAEDDSHDLNENLASPLAEEAEGCTTAD